VIACEELSLGRLSDKVALITGAARGIGEAIARAFVREGADVYLTDIDSQAAEAVVDELGTRAMFTNLDGVFLGCKYAIRAMRPAKKGSIINVSWIAATPQ
jgi:NAD(P)-dependent dehydrogenase (short-subunit alcohol dehydrogenase family)